MFVQFIVFLTLSTLICRGTDISKCFSESFGFRDNESRLYLAFEKTDPFIHLIVQNEQAPLTNLWAKKKYTHSPGCQKSGAFHIRIKKNRVSHIFFVEERGPIIYLAALKKGAIRHAHPYYVIYRLIPAPRPTHQPREPSPHPLRHTW